MWLLPDRYYWNGFCEAGAVTGGLCFFSQSEILSACQSMCTFRVMVHCVSRCFGEVWCEQLKSYICMHICVCVQYICMIMFYNALYIYIYIYQIIKKITFKKYCIISKAADKTYSTYRRSTYSRPNI